MKNCYLSCALMLCTITALAQNDDIRREKAKVHLGEIVELIKKDHVSQLADLIHYPLRRPDPVPDIENKESFILYYPTLFDESLKNIFIDTMKIYIGIYVNPYSYEVGFHDGDIYLDENGLITGINYSSQKEITLIEALNNETLALLHPSIKKWKSPELTLRSDNFLIRVDLMEDNSARYISWSMPKSISDKPDLILNNGEIEYQGNMGSIIYTFKNGDWQYIVEYVAVCGDADDCGYFLRLLQNESEKKKIKMKRIK